MSHYQEVMVELKDRRYPVWIGEGVLADSARWLPLMEPYTKHFVIADEAVATLYAQPMMDALNAAGHTPILITIPSGEQSKSFAQFEALCNTLLSHQPDRKSLLIAVGGGVIGDLVGFTASALLRGVDFVQVPTTLLAMVDSSVGGKTAINSVHGKNLIGAFYQPKAVLADLATLATLPAREWNAGYAEVVKYGLIRDAAFYDWLKANSANLASDMGLLSHAVKHCVEMKAAVVAEDETEKNIRALLNFGHTLGHAVEAETGYSSVLHGEAVAVGMVLAAKLSAALGHCDASIAEDIAQHLTQMGLPAHLTDIAHPFSAGALIKHCYGDKKAEGGTLTFVLLRAVGNAFVEKKVAEPVIAQMLAQAGVAA